MKDQKFATIALNSVPYITPVIFHNLIRNFGSPLSVFKATLTDITRTSGVTPSLAKNIKELDVDKVAYKQFMIADKLGACIYTFDEPGYPEPLKSTFTPPPVISLLGSLQEDDNISISVVGSRSPTVYGKGVTEQLVRSLVQGNISIISGLARGIDKVAHVATLGAGGRTIAVLGNGLNLYYPPEHRKLQDTIAKDGLVISQFPFDAPPERMNFPMRNFLVATLSLGTVIVEAAEKSGALITATIAVEEGKEVFAIPGLINSSKSKGPHKLIQKGVAKLIVEASDILDELPDYLLKKIASKLDQKESEKEMRIDLSSDESLIFKALTGSPSYIDDVSQMSGLPLKTVSSLLLNLELRGLVKQSPGKYFHKS
ncbi:MAG: DNA-processing protein DprA [Nitrospinota bacterium]